jgi:hypothetical protein
MPPNRQAREEELRIQWKSDVSRFIDAYRRAVHLSANKPLPVGVGSEEMIVAILNAEFRNDDSHS